MTSNNNAVIRSSIESRSERQDSFVLSTKTFDFIISDDDDDDDEFDLPSQVTNPPNVILASSNVQSSALRPAVSQQPTVEMLQSLGIKVRDFAYESTLPPIAPVPRVPRQIQPSARSFKRTSRDWDEEDAPSPRPLYPQFGREATNADTATNRKPNYLVRRPTEPLEFDSSTSRHMTECADLSRPFLLGSQLPFPIFHQIPPKPPFGSPPTSPLFGPPSQESSQEVSLGSELVITPTDGESLYTEDTSSKLADKESLAFESEETAHSQMGFFSPSQPAMSPLPLLRSSVSPFCVSPPSQAVDTGDSLHFIPQIPHSLQEPKRGIKTPTARGSTEKPIRYLLRRRSLLSAHTPMRSRYPHPLTLTPAKTGSPKVSPLPRRRRLQQPAASR